MDTERLLFPLKDPAKIEGIVVHTCSPGLRFSPLIPNLPMETRFFSVPQLVAPEEN
jgi:hypothetical protein